MPEQKDEKAAGGKQAGGKGKEVKAPPPPPPPPPTPLEVFHTNLRLIDKYEGTRDVLHVLRVMRYTRHLCLHLPRSHMLSAIDTYISSAESKSKLLALLGGLSQSGGGAAAPMEPEGSPLPAAAASGGGGGSKAAEPSAAEGKAPPRLPRAGGASAPDLEAYLWLVVLSKACSCRAWAELATGATYLLDCLFAAHNRRTLDVFQARAHFYLALSAEALGGGGSALAALRPRQLAAFRTACLRHDELGQASLLNLLLRGHIACGEFDAARALLAKTKFPEAASAAQLARFLFYSGRVRAVLLEYSEAFSLLQQAARKAPPEQPAFVSAVTAFMVVTQLLMGEVPERRTFNGKPALAPYLALARAVREGSLPRFRAAVEAHAAAFARHGTLSLVRRLDANVIRAGLRRVASAYSCIRFADVAVKLRLGSAEDAEFLCAKAVRDGVLDAELDNSAGTLVARAAANPYNSPEPQAAFHRRISFLLDVHHEAQRSMRYPAKAPRADMETAEERRKREEEEQNLLEAIDKGEFDDGSGDD